jgi:hypothetical protein
MVVLVATLELDLPRSPRRQAHHPTRHVEEAIAVAVVEVGAEAGRQTAPVTAAAIL